jgi:hypothetical protein
VCEKVCEFLKYDGSQSMLHVLVTEKQVEGEVCAHARALGRETHGAHGPLHNAAVEMAMNGASGAAPFLPRVVEVKDRRHSDGASSYGRLGTHHRIVEHALNDAPYLVWMD